MMDLELEIREHILRTLKNGDEMDLGPDDFTSNGKYDLIQVKQIAKIMGVEGLIEYKEVSNNTGFPLLILLPLGLTYMKQKGIVLPKV